ncbi:hypothetical protein [Paenibacillus aestuarii]|uniref:Uncharacterized protein n=1 Tax=Paenibacillus aestuarii TaxID=516965 RepID=A0ABW0K3K2_9BACL|nr:hypothetical protein [Paenibacillus aestuarii]
MVNKITDAHIQHFLERLAEDNSVILNEFTFTQQGQPLSDQQAISFLAFIKQECGKGNLHS